MTTPNELWVSLVPPPQLQALPAYMSARCLIQSDSTHLGAPCIIVLGQAESQVGMLVKDTRPSAGCKGLDVYYLQSISA
jgi:hypothetical protein